MTSPVDTSLKYFTSQMSGVPALSGTQGSLVALLDAFLKDGADTKTLTSLIVAGGVATATYTGAHSAQVDTVVLVAGVTGGPAGFAGLNGEQKITAKAPAGNTVSFATALADGTYTGAITIKMAPLGWLKPFAGASKAGYKSADPTSTGCYLRVDDTGTTMARVIGYESMSDVDTGVGPFPSATQIAGGGYWAKSSAASAVATQWLLIGDAKAFFFINAAAVAGNANYLASVTRGFGDPISMKPGGDPFGCFLNCSLTSTPIGATDGGLDRAANVALSYSPRAHTGLGAAVAQFAKPLTGSNTLSSGQDTLFGIFPNESVDGVIRLGRRVLTQSTFPGIRAFVPGVFHIPQDRLAGSFGNFDKFTSADGRKYIFMLTSALAFDNTATSTFGAVPIDVTGPWR